MPKYTSLYRPISTIKFSSVNVGLVLHTIHAGTQILRCVSVSKWNPEITPLRKTGSQ